jgi:RimJ/RimL family protein N-acetyltransferase
LNTICKFLLLQYCFEDLTAIRVQFRTKQGNSRSRAALQKICARFEGIMRKDKIEPDGNSRSTAFYRILGDEWPEVKAMLVERMRRPGPAAGDA